MNAVAVVRKELIPIVKGLPRMMNVYLVRYQPIRVRLKVRNAHLVDKERFTIKLGESQKDSVFHVLNIIEVVAVPGILKMKFK